MPEEMKAGKGRVYMHTQYVLDTKEKEEIGREDVLDMTISQSVGLGVQKPGGRGTTIVQIVRS